MKTILTTVVGVLGLLFVTSSYAEYNVDLPAPFQGSSAPVKHQARVASSERGYTSDELETNPGFPETRSPGSKVVIVDPKMHAWGAYNEEGQLVKFGRASTGANYCPDIHRACHTPVGQFAVMSKGGADCKSTRYPVGKGGAPMPYCMYFTTNFALHGSYEVPPNRNASHGCVRMIPDSAEWLYENFVSVGTHVIIRPY